MPRDNAAAARGPYFILDRATYGLPLSGFDWLAHCDQLLTSKHDWARLRGVDCVCVKGVAILAAHFDDLALAGGPHARRRECAALQSQLVLRGKPERLRRFLGVRYLASKTGAFQRVEEAG